MNVQPPTRQVVLLEDVIGRLLRDLPDTADAIRARRDLVVAASAVFDAQHSPLAAAIADCVATLRARSSAIRAPAPAAAEPVHAAPAAQATGAPEGEEAVDAFHLKSTVALPQVPPEPATRPTPVVAEVPKAVHWGPEERLLYDDILNLFDMGDQAGAMTSLERMIMLSPHAEELATFLDKNGPLLLKLYQEHLGSLDRVPVPLKDARPVRIPTSHAPLVMDVLRLVDGHRSIREVMRKSRLGDVQTLASIAHLTRSGFIEIA